MRELVRFLTLSGAAGVGLAVAIAGSPAQALIGLLIFVGAELAVALWILDEWNEARRVR